MFKVSKRIKIATYPSPYLMEMYRSAMQVH